MFSRKIIVKKTAQVGLSTLASRLFGIVRELFMVSYLGVSGISDVFLTAFKIPNSLRKIFAEGALSAALIPTVVGMIKDHDRKSIAGLMSLAFLLFEGLLLVICALVMVYAKQVIGFIAPGFTHEQVLNAVPLLRVLMPFVFFISSSAIIASALNAVGHFFVPAISPTVFNCIFILGLAVSLFLDLPVIYLCWFILAGGAVQFVLHWYVYRQQGFYFGRIGRDEVKKIGSVVTKFLLCLPTVSVLEFMLFIDTSFASFLPEGSISLLYYANRFVGIPLGVFAVAFSTILLPHFSRISMYAPKRLHFYLLESTKVVFWVTFPVILLMAFFSKDIFSTIFLSKKFTMVHVHEAAHILVLFLVGLFFFSLNKILINIFYSMHVTWIPAVVALGASLINICFNFLFIFHFKAAGLALATSFSSMAQTLLFIFILRKKYDFTLYIKQFFTFVVRYVIQVFMFVPAYLLLFFLIQNNIACYCSPHVAAFFLVKIGLWLWVGPLTGMFLILLFLLRGSFGVKLYFLQ